MSEHPAIRAYMARLEPALRRLGVADAHDIARDVRSHIDEAVGYGKSVDAVIDALGPPETLARAYAAELLIDGTRTRGGGVGRFLQLAGLIGAGGILTFVVVVTLGSLGLSFGLSGVLLLAIGTIEAAGIHLPHVEMAGLPPLLVAALGPVFLALAWAAFAGLGRYTRFIAGVWRATLPRHAG